MPALAGLRLDGRGRWAARTAAAHADWRASLATPPQPGALDMGEVVRHLQERLPADAILTNGAGNFATWTNKHFAFGARPAPARAAVGRHGLRAARRHRREGRPPGAHGGLRRRRRRLPDDLPRARLRASRPAPGRSSSSSTTAATAPSACTRSAPTRARVSFTDIENPDFVALAAAYGAHAERVTATADFPAAFARAAASPTGAVLDLVIDTESLTPRQTPERHARRSPRRSDPCPTTSAS